MCTAGRNLQSSGLVTLSSELEFDDSSLYPDHGRVGSVAGS